MTGGRMHDDEVLTDVDLVRRLLRSQFPEWAELPIERVESAGTDNALYRLGEDLVVRMPRVESAIGQAEKERRWLPRFAPHLPVAIPTPIASGDPGEGYPWDWSIYGWLEGENATIDKIADQRLLAADLASFVAVLREIDSTGGPLAGRHNFYRGVPLAMRDEPTREALASCGGLVDTEAALAAWEASLEVPLWEEAPVWVHGDIQSGNLLAVDGRLSAVIDFGGLGLGDPAVDLIVAWNLLSAGTRPAFREALEVDDATWLRGRGWALSALAHRPPLLPDDQPDACRDLPLRHRRGAGGL